MDVNALFSRAEQAFVAGKLASARADLEQVQRLAGDHPAVLHLRALVEKKSGALGASRQAFERALKQAPRDPQINNNFANLLEMESDWDAALRHLDLALEASPGFADARYNRALLLQKMDRHAEALAELDRVAARAPAGAKIHSARGNSLRQLGRLDDAAIAYDAALRIEPQRPTALHGRARVAMERGEPDASSFFRQGLAVQPDDPELNLGLAESLEAEGKPGAVEALAAAVAARPQWVDGQSALARMRWEAGEGTSFARGFKDALKAHPRDRQLWFAYASSLAAAQMSREAADASAEARAHVGPDPALELLEAVHASEAGDLPRADALFAGLPPGLANREVLELRHRVRQRDYGKALALADSALRQDPDHVGAWAMAGLLWRLTGDLRAAWLHEQPGLIQVEDLELTSQEIGKIAERLRSLHRAQAHPLGQSLRGGTQTRGVLFDRTEPEIMLLRDRVTRAVAGFWDRLPAADPEHPLLKRRNLRPRLEGSWSVRLTRGGFHVSHIHPKGLLSSACYLVVPEARAAQEGWLQVGSPPEGLADELAPLLSVEPVPGRMALFPSTLFHGTRPFEDGERLTAAFDVVAA